MQSTSPQSNRRKKTSIASVLFLIATIFGGLFLWLNAQNVLDWVSYLQYKPTSEVASIASNSGMTDRGKFAFYSAQPSVDSPDTFNQNCDRQEEHTAILGCYFANRIYIFDVNEPRLDGIKEVTATHEMLHAIYQRMSDGERNRINKLLQAEYDKLKDNQKFYERMEFYERTEPGQFNNELHSIIATEIRDISDELEEYYAKYFDREKILDLYEGYESEFTRLENQADKLKKQLDSLSKRIESTSLKYKKDLAKLDADIASFNARAESGGFSSQYEFDVERQQLLARVDAIRAQRTAVNKLVDQYNNLREDYNAIVIQQNDLQKSLDSTLEPAPTLQ